jgi:small subunit ribosomal protein S8
MHTDTISDLLTRIRNASRVKHRFVEVSYSKFKVAILEVLKDQGYISNFKVFGEGPKRTIKIALRYDPQTKESAITEIVRVSKPGIRKYAGVDSIPYVMNGLGIAILSTPKGVLTDKKARELNVGGEIICYVY